MLTNDRGRQVRRARLLRHMKQSHLAELMGVDQATVSRWERGTLALSDGRWSAVLQLLTGPSDSSVRRCAEASGAILRPQSPSGSDRTHCLLAASPARQRELRIDLAELLGKSLRVYASPR
uniref:HTH cro/C1-type domain-containing protein n=1 Tax=Salmonella typhimurium TaxID=90371 RepID=Q9F171_SALTM|nr:unknown [Salmonella enterica subsp. enterica serovar Typhimurium]